MVLYTRGDEKSKKIYSKIYVLNVVIKNLMLRGQVHSYAKNVSTGKQLFCVINMEVKKVKK